MFPDLTSSELSVVTDYPYDVIDEPTVWITMADGVRLAARVYRPDTTKPVPVVVEIIPYRRQDGTLPVDERMHPYWAGHGVAAVRVDLRGCGDSDGILGDEYLPLEQQDAVAVIEWASQQPWSNGNVGMTGLSWGGFASLQVAACKPPALKAIIAIGATVDRYNDDVHYKNGCLLNENFGWGSSLTAFTTRPPDPFFAGGNWRETWMHRLENLDLFAAEWFRHQTRDDYWKHGSVSECYDDIAVPVMIISGWNDLYVNALPALLDNLQGCCEALCGPWGHHFPHLASPGPTYDYLGAALAWWQRWLSDEPAPASTAKSHLAYIKDSSAPDPSAADLPGRWIRETGWPTPSVTMSRLYLGQNSLCPEQAGVPTLDIHSPVGTGAEAGEWIPHCAGLEMQGDHKEIDRHSTCFDSATLDDPVEILGRPEFGIALSSDCPTGHLIVRLCDVGPDGRSELVSIGVLNLAHRMGNKCAVPMPVGQVQHLNLQLDHCGHRFLPGHRIRVALSTAYWPFIWPAVDNPVLSIANHPGFISLPVRSPGSDEDIHLPGPVAPPASALSEFRPPASERKVSRDPDQNKSYLEINDDLGEYRIDSHGLVTSAKKAELYEITGGDPLSAKAQITWEFDYSRAGWHIRTETETRMSCDRDTYHLAATVRAFEQGNCVFERTYEHEIARSA